MKAVYYFIFIIFLVFPGYVQTPVLVIEDFSAEEVGVFPKNWEAREDKGKELYIVAKDKYTDNKYLSVTDRGESVQVGKEYKWSLKEFPVLQWKWRVKKLPDGASEDRKETNDSAAGLYVVFDKAWFFIPRTIKYVWSSSLKKGTIIKKGYTYVIVLESGESKLGKWIHESVDVFSDYKRLFKKEPPSPRGIAILTDANATSSLAVADYDHFIAVPKASEQRIPASY